MVVLNELGSSSSWSAHHDHNHRYDVFLSFRGADTRNNFTDHLYNALLDAGIKTFLDDEEIETGEPLKPELESAIKSSRASIVVLSKNYASSTWCLQELVLILEQNRKFNQIVIPVFYHVEPTHVRKQENSFGDAMSKHKQSMETETNAEKRSEWDQKMALWKRALTEVSGLKGKHAKDRKETEFIKDIVNDIHRRLGVRLSNALPLLIGREYYIEYISSWLTDESCHSSDILTIVGIGGIGKTSLAKHVFLLQSSKFNKNSFIEDINTRCNERFNGLLDLQKQLHGDISKKIELQINDVSTYTSKIENALARDVVFIVLDDIDSLDQLDALLGNKGLHPGSKIIITTKNASLTERCALFNPNVQHKHTSVLLNGLRKSESLKLLCIHAFKSDALTKGYKEVSKNLVKYCDGHPLALQVLGKSLHKRDVAYWEECIKGLKKEPHSRIKKALHMSFDTLPLNDKELFKHIACFFVEKDVYTTEQILNACDMHTRSGITNLIERCLLSIGWDNKLMMHQLVQEMGRDLVRQESPDKPWKRSRLCCHEESFKVLEQKKGTKNIVGLALDMRILEKEKLSGLVQLRTDALNKMDNLKLLQLNHVKMNGSYMNISKELRWLCMHGFHFKSLPSELPMENLVVLDMSHSNIESFDLSYSSSQPFVSRLKRLTGSSSKDKRLLRSLKILDLSYCEQLCSLGGFFLLPALERLIVKKCISLIEVCESIDQCVELVHIDMSHCYKLKKLPISLGKLKKVKTILLDGCNPRDPQIETIPNDWKLILFSLPSSLRILTLSNNKLFNESFPTDFSCLAMLHELSLSSNPIVSMPNCVRTLPRLERLFMDNCDMMTSIVHPPSTLRYLSIHNLYKRRLQKIKFNQGMFPLNVNGVSSAFLSSSVEIDGIIKIEAMEGVEKKVLHSLGWTNLEFITEQRLRFRDTFGRGLYKCQTQIYYEFGIFSTFFEGDGMPNWIERRREGPTISFLIPSSPKKLQGLNFYCVEMNPVDDTFGIPLIRISNLTGKKTWIYDHYTQRVMLRGKCLSFLSHWMFGPNEMKRGDYITITVACGSGNQITKECGIGLMYDDDVEADDSKIEEEEDVLGYYKSWNYIIGGDLSTFQFTTGQYVLDNKAFVDVFRRIHTCTPFTDYGANYKEKELDLIAFSQKKREHPSHGFIKKVE